MDNTLVNGSKIWKQKAKFFLFRALTYFSFLLLPVWVQKTQQLNTAGQCLVMFFYVAFMVGQWFLLGKEIDHRLKIYFRVNSSIDRVIYRFLMGMFVMVLYFNLLSFLPGKWIYNSFWVTWALLGLFYSWPTRGKIIQESVSTNFSEFRFLDSFERTVLSLVFILFVFSIPALPNLFDTEALKLFLDPNEKISNFYWNFLLVNYYPFKKYPVLYKIAWCMHFYLVHMGVYLLIVYGFLRYFVSRRLSILGVFALLSSWSFTKLIAANYGTMISTTFSALWVWSLFWVFKSSTYRSGLFLGLVGFWGAIVDKSNSLLIGLQTLITYIFLLGDKTFWYKRQTLKYASFGFGLTILLFITNIDSIGSLISFDNDFLGELSALFKRKAFFSLSLFGLIVLFVKRLMPKTRMVQGFKVDDQLLDALLISFGMMFAYSYIFSPSLFNGFAIMWPMTLLSVIPLELLFQSTSRLRSRRNMIYVIYIIICLLDSHFEGRVKIFLRLFN